MIESIKREYVKPGATAQIWAPGQSGFIEATIIRVDKDLVVMQPDEDYQFAHDVIYRHFDEIINVG